MENKKTNEEGRKGCVERLSVLTPLFQFWGEDFRHKRPVFYLAYSSFGEQDLAIKDFVLYPKALELL